MNAGPATIEFSITGLISWFYTLFVTLFSSNISAIRGVYNFFNRLFIDIIFLIHKLLLKELEEQRNQLTLRKIAIGKLNMITPSNKNLIFINKKGKMHE